MVSTDTLKEICHDIGLSMGRLVHVSLARGKDMGSIGPEIEIIKLSLTAQPCHGAKNRLFELKTVRTAII